MYKLGQTRSKVLNQTRSKSVIFKHKGYCFLRVFRNYTDQKFNDFFLSGISFATIHESQDCRGRRRGFLRRHLDISWAITAESSPLHIRSSSTRTKNLYDSLSFFSNYKEIDDLKSDLLRRSDT